tara:strand:+ start:415 stop:861 length:447 start_codon:yes stop_codon:yes gene_type:complete
MEVIGCDNYLIYEDGKVQNKKTKRYLKSAPNKKGYLHVCLYKNGKGNTHNIHRLVAIHYIPNPDNKPEVDHINRINTDNRVENLRWTTISENGQNTGVRKNNKLRIKNICYHKRMNRYVYKKIIRGIKHVKYFKTLEEAVEYKKEYEK